MLEEGDGVFVEGQKVRRRFQSSRLRKGKQSSWSWVRERCDQFGKTAVSSGFLECFLIGKGYLAGILRSAITRFVRK